MLKGIVVLALSLSVGGHLAASNARVAKTAANKLQTVIDTGKHIFIGNGLRLLAAALGTSILLCTASPCVSAIAQQQDRLGLQQQETEQRNDYRQKPVNSLGFDWYGLESKAYGGVVYGISAEKARYVQGMKKYIRAEHYEGVLIHYQRRNRSYIGWVIDTSYTVGKGTLHVKHLDGSKATIGVADVSGVYEIYPYNHIHTYRHGWVTFIHKGKRVYGWAARHFNDGYDQIKVTAQGDDLQPVSKPYYVVVRQRHGSAGTTVGERETSESLTIPFDAVTVKKEVLEELLLHRVATGWQFNEVRQLVAYGARNFDAGIALATDKGYGDMTTLLATLKDLAGDSVLTALDEVLVDKGLLEAGMLLGAAADNTLITITLIKIDGSKDIAQAAPEDNTLVELMVSAGANNLPAALRIAAERGNLNAAWALIKLGADNYEEALQRVERELQRGEASADQRGWRIDVFGMRPATQRRLLTIKKLLEHLNTGRVKPSEL